MALWGPAARMGSKLGWRYRGQARRKASSWAAAERSVMGWLPTWVLSQYINRVSAIPSARWACFMLAISTGFLMALRRAVGLGAVHHGNMAGNAGQEGGVDPPGVQHDPLAGGEAAYIGINTLVGTQGDPVGLQLLQDRRGEHGRIGKENRAVLGKEQIAPGPLGCRPRLRPAGSAARRCPPGK